jgi:hypothetical protein
MNHPVGINLAANNSMTALSLSFAPLTRAVGAVATWNILLRLAIITSALAAQAVCGRFVRWAPAAFVGGIIYAFSGYMTFWAVGYLFFIFVPLPPIVFLGLHSIFVRGVKRPFLAGAWVGVALGLEYLISPEVAAVTGIMAAAAIAVVIGGWRDRLRCRWKDTRSACLGIAVALFVLTAYPIGFARWGTANLHGFTVVNSGPADVLGILSPGPRLLIHPGPQVWTSFGHYFYSAPLYLGIPAVVGTIAVTIWLRRRPVVLASGILALLSGLLSLGSNLVIDNKSTGIPLPFALIAHLPVLSYIVPARFALMTAFFVAIILSSGIDTVHSLIVGHQTCKPTVARRTTGVILPAIIAIAILLPLFPSASMPDAPPPISKFFTSTAIHQIPLGATVLIYPYPNAAGIVASTTPTGSSTEALLDQVASDLQFQVTGGYGWMPPRRASGLPDPTPLSPLAIERFFTSAYFGKPVPEVTTQAARAELQRNLRTFLTRYGVSSVVIDHVGVGWTMVGRQVTALLGKPDLSEPSDVWFDVQSRLGAFHTA